MSTLALKTSTADSLHAQPGAHFASRAATLRDLIKGEAAKPENAATTALTVVEAMREAGLYWLLVPESLGGADVGVVEFAALAEEVASADSSTGWSVAAQGIATMVAATFCTDAHVERMFGGSRLPVMSATYAPTGKAVQVGDSFKGGGRYSFGSGISHADWVGSALVLQGDGKPVMQADGRPRVVGAFLPTKDINILGNWDVAGMEATGSFDYEITERTVPGDWTFNQYWTEPMRQSHAANIGTLVAVCAGHTGVALGIARRSLHEAAHAATLKKRLYATASTADTPTFRLDFVRNDALFQAARARAYEIFANADRKANAGEALSESEIQQVRQVTTWTHHICRDIAVFAYSSVSSSLRLPSILARNVMDVSVAVQHVIVSDMTLFDASSSVIDQWADESAQSIGGC
jgi:alkylation response protein AidB-like acyl-CoA dehydrogenase